jgi:hypothetical protein
MLKLSRLFLNRLHGLSVAGNLGGKKKLRPGLANHLRRWRYLTICSLGLPPGLGGVGVAASAGAAGAGSG